ncbi:hypothetical protein RN001_007476 [Aquatica leii]|uniref:Death-inducer obliterator 1 n=1 Tax=Aquatica leii TaxID=1421715 RepID=A0AAN7SQY0_9COLE|nr:hypothetical protein RN001_007476 [Aquatica leii]
MSHSVVKVTETPINDSLVLIIDKDGHITPDQKTLQDYLEKQSGETEIPFMQVNKTDGKMEVTCGSLKYLPSHDEEGSSNKVDMNEIERNLMSFRMDHDYTPFTCAEELTSSKEIAEIDELAETLSILEGSNVSTVSEDKSETPQVKLAKPDNKSIKKLINVQPLNKRKFKTVAEPGLKLPNRTTPKVKNIKQKSPEVSVEDEDIEDEEEEEEEEEEEDEDYLMDSEELDDDANDSDYEIDQSLRTKPTKKISRSAKTKFLVERPTNVKKPMKTIKTIKPLLTRHSAEPKILPLPVKPEKRIEIIADIKISPEKKIIPKKEKKTPKPIPDDFALFSTPDIIRRVGGKQESSTPSTPTTPNIPESPKSIRAANIFHGTLNKSISERNSVDLKNKRLSVDGKLVPFETDSGKQLLQRSGSVNTESMKKKDRRYSLDIKKAAASTVHTSSSKTGNNVTVQSFDESLGGTSNESMELEPIPSAEDIRAIIQNEDTKTFTSNLVIPDPPEQSDEQPSINLDNTGLDLDQSLLDNINSDLIPEDILYQVAQSLVGNAELQNAIDKSLVDGNLVLDTTDADPITPDHSSMQLSTASNQNIIESTTSLPMKGTPVMRSGGRMVVIPPIERPTTRSRNKNKQEVGITTKTAKVFDDEHVSGGELDSSSDGDKSDDDDPDKLWCICNQPHNNRFMICCDSCEEWYHGKCVNVTKAMGHMMEVKGREWICLYCKDPLLSRPAAAARRIRKASHTSSTDTSSDKKEKLSLVAPIESSAPVPGCLVCGKPCRSNSIYCSDPCILKHAKVVEKVVVFERSSGTIYTGSSAPTTTNLDKWLQQHPGFEVVRSANANKPVTTKQVTHSKLKIIKTVESPDVSPSTSQRKNLHVNILRNPVKQVSQPPQQPSPIPNKQQVTSFKIVSKQVTTPPKAKLIQPPPLIKTPPATTPSKPKPPSTLVKTPTPTPTKEKIVPQKTPKSRQAEETSHPNQAENIRDNVKKTLFEQLTNRLNLVDDIKLSKEELTKISTEIESQLYKCFGDTGQKYRNKYRSLIFNIKDIKNQTLWRRICEKSINAYQLVRLSPDDLASQELALWRERENKHQLEMITKSELEQLGRNRQYVFKTHKGEQVLEDNRPSDAVDNTEVVMGLAAEDGSSGSTPDSKKDGKDKDKKNSKHSRTDRHHDHKQSKDRDRSSRRDKKREHRSSSKDKAHHKRSRSKESSRHSDKHRSSSKERDRYHRSNHKSYRHKKDIQSATEKLDKKSKEILEQLVDNKIVPPLEDRLWKHVQQEDITTAPIAESDSDHEPTSTVTIPTPPRVGEIEEPEVSPESISEDNKLKEDSSDENVFMKDADSIPNSIDDDVGLSPPPPRFKSDYIWKGTINMVDVAQISITAHEVSGDCFGLGEELPQCLDVVGRISPDTVWDYIGKMKCSNSKVISLLRLNATNVEEKMPYIALYSYLSSRNRLGVVKSTNKAVKDFYILPLASQKPLPQSLLPLNGPGFEESRPALLLGIIVRDKRKRPLYVTNSSAKSKRAKVDGSIQLDRSYTPPPSCDLKLSSTSSVKNTKDDTNDEDEPYTPEDSDPDSAPSTNEDKVSSNLNATDLSKLLTNTVKSASFLETGLTAQTFEPFSNKFDTIPGLDESAGLPANSQDIQRKMEELDQRIAMQKAEIHNMSQDIASSTTTGIGTNALASIALPQNLQQILDSIKGIHPGTDPETPQISTSKSLPSSDLTIPLILPKINARTQPPSIAPASSTTIPLNLPKSKTKFSSTTSPQHSNKKSDDKSTSVLSSLSEEELIRKAAEMLGETESSSSKANTVDSKSSPLTSGLFGGGSVLYPSSSFVSPSISSKSTQLELDQPPIPGLD